MSPPLVPSFHFYVHQPSGFTTQTSHQRTNFICPLKTSRTKKRLDLLPWLRSNRLVLTTKLGFNFEQKGWGVKINTAAARSTDNLVR